MLAAPKRSLLLGMSTQQNTHTATGAAVKETLLRDLGSILWPRRMPVCVCHQDATTVLYPCPALQPLHSFARALLGLLATRGCESNLNCPRTQGKFTWISAVQPAVVQLGQKHQLFPLGTTPHHTSSHHTTGHHMAAFQPKPKPQLQGHRVTQLADNTVTTCACMLRSNTAHNLCRLKRC
jgi:hypothetical protein